MAKKIFSKLGKILLLSTVMASAPLALNAQDKPIGRHDNAVPLEQYETSRNGEKIHYMRYESPAEIGSKNITIIFVEQKDGKIISYMDLYGDDMQIDKVQLLDEKGNETIDAKMNLPERQKEFDSYFKIIEGEIASILD